MHGYFVSLKLYDAARIIANPFAYAEHREKIVREKMEKMAETRIRTKKEVGVKVNKALAEKIQREEEKERKREQRRKAKMGEDTANDLEDANEKPSLLNDPRFKQIFEDPAFAVDEDSREYALMNPSAVAQRKGARAKTVVEQEDDESDRVSSDGLGESDGSSDSDDQEEDDSDSSDAGGTLCFVLRCSITHGTSSELNKFDPRARPGQKNARAQEAYTRNRERNRLANINLVPMRPPTGSNGGDNFADKNATYGQRRAPKLKGMAREAMATSADHDFEMSWVPSSSKQTDIDGTHISGGGAHGKPQAKRKGMEVFGAGMEKGGEDPSIDLTEGERKGRTQRRKGVRSGSRNTFRRLES
jgi:ribosome biogenesis protein ENP2